MNLLVNWLIWMLAPTAFVVVLAIILSFTPLKTPKQTDVSWFQRKDW